MSVTITSPVSTPVTATLVMPTSGNWQASNPLTPTGSVLLNVVNAHPTLVAERSASHFGLGNQYPDIVADVVSGTDGSLSVKTYGVADDAAITSLATSQAVYFLQSPFGVGLYVRFGIPPGGTGGGGANKTKESVLLPSGSSSPYREHGLIFTNVARPPA